MFCRNRSPGRRCSANLHMRSWTYDSELSVAVLNQQRDPRAPPDPGGLGDGTAASPATCACSAGEHHDLAAGSGVQQSGVRQAR